MAGAMKDQRPASMSIAPRGGEIAPEVLAELAARLKAKQGFDLLSYKSKVLHRRLRTRLRACSCDDYQEYLRVLDEDPLELEQLYKALIINVSNFFRNAETYWFLRDRVLPELLARKREGDGALTLVSAACAEGEEPYSLAMVMRTFFARELERVRVRIIGIDIDEEALAKARAGSYPLDRVAETPAAFRERFFVRSGKNYELTPEARSLVEFRRHDLRSGLPLTAVDLVMCRNLLIYFKREYQLRLLRAIHAALAEGGYLVLGKTETLGGELREQYQVVDLSEHVYRKAGVDPCAWR
jgi:chemotaxis protein methyltransferase CheR